jgi:pimeloyl-ACP methyl ester carboxylesterase
MILSFRLLAAAVLLGALACKPDQPPEAAPAAAAPTQAAQTIQAAPDQYFTRDSLRFRYREAGQGDPVILLHGYTQRLEGLQDLADSLAGTNRVIVMDERGFGESTKFSDPAKYGRAFGDDVIALMDSLKIPKAHFVGHSMGALIAADLALRYPARTSTISLLAGPFTDSTSLAKLWRPFVADLEQGRGLKGFVKWLVPGIPDSMATGFDQQLQASNDHGSLVAALKAMPAIVLPNGAKPDSGIRVLIAVGGGDPLLRMARALKALWPNATLVEAAGANHFDVVTRAEVVGAIRTVIRG